MTLNRKEQKRLVVLNQVGRGEPGGAGGGSTSGAFAASGEKATGGVWEGGRRRLTPRPTTHCLHACGGGPHKQTLRRFVGLLRII